VETSHSSASSTALLPQLASSSPKPEQRTADRSSVEISGGCISWFFACSGRRDIALASAQRDSHFGGTYGNQNSSERDRVQRGAGLAPRQRLQPRQRAVCAAVQRLAPKSENHDAQWQQKAARGRDAFHARVGVVGLHASALLLPCTRRRFLQALALP
jgi:hypothetical protein